MLVSCLAQQQVKSPSLLILEGDDDDDGDQIPDEEEDDDEDGVINEGKNSPQFEPILKRLKPQRTLMTMAMVSLTTLRTTMVMV